MDRYCVESIEDNIIKLENLTTKEIIYITKEELEFSVKENDILLFKDNKYYLDNATKDKRLKTIKEKLEKLKKL